MASKIKNIIIFTVLAAILILVYFVFIKKAPEEQNLTSTSTTPITVTTGTTAAEKSTIDQNSSLAKEFLTVLLSVKSIKLDDTIFSDKAFINLHDSSILINATVGDEGRLNPFAPIGYEASRANTLPVESTPATSPLVNPITPTSTTP